MQLENLVLLAGVCIAAIWDLKWRRIPNQLTIGIAVYGVLVHGVLQWRLLDSLLGGVLGLLLLGIPYLLGGMGAGDVKLLAGLGLFLGWQQILVCAAGMAIMGAILGLLLSTPYQAVRQSLGRPLYAGCDRTLEQSSSVFSGRSGTKGEGRLTIAYAVAIFFGLLGVELLHLHFRSGG